MYRHGLTVVVCLLALVGLAVGLTGSGSNAIPGALSIPGISDLTGHGYHRTLSPRVAHFPYNNDVGVSKIVSPGEYVPLGDTVFPRAEVRSFGTQTETNVPVICVMYDSAAGVRVYGPDTVYVASLASGGIDTVAFPFWVPPTQEKVYFDTMTTALPGDQDTANDWKPGRFAVSESCVGWLTYNDGVFSNAFSWISAGNEMAEKFGSPIVPLVVNKANIWLSSFSGSDYASEVRIYGDDGTPYHYPGTELGAYVGSLHTSVWTAMYKNVVMFSPPITVNYDSFYVSYYQTSISPAYPYVGLCYDLPCDADNDWGRYNGSWGIFGYDCMSFGIDAHYTGLLLDALLKEITVPPGYVDPNTAFAPQVVVKNAGLEGRNNVPVSFMIVRDSKPCDTMYVDSANSGTVAAGHEVTVTFPDSVKLPEGTYTMTSMTRLPFDGNPANDTLVRPLKVLNTGVADKNESDVRPSVSIAPNPLGRLATVRYSLPKAGLVTLDLYDVTGRQVLTQTITAGRYGTADLDLHKLRVGVYTVKVKASGFSTTQKLVIEH